MSRFRLPRPRGARALTAAAAVLAALTPVASGTWSIVLVDTATGEVAIGSATCITGIDLETLVPVLRVGVGGACAQAQVDGSGQNRRLIWDELAQGTHPQKILDKLEKRDSQHQSRQYGIGDLLGRKATFTGSNTIPWAGGVVGRVGTLEYAIQGNILVGANVVTDAEAAVVGTSGDLATRLMAAMEAAAAAGGDSRCTSRGKSADVGFMLVSRLGDTDGGCDATGGCASGVYYLDLNAAFLQSGDPDPVLVLRGLYTSWRSGLGGRPDHVLSTQTLADAVLPGNGTATTTLALQLVDVDGIPLPGGGASVTVSHAPDSAGLSTIGPVTDLGNGSYTVPLTAGVGQGLDVLRTVVDDGVVTVRLYPDVALALGNTLTANATSLSAAAGGTVDFGLFGPGSGTGRAYLLLASASGTVPGLPFGQVTLPLNWDALLLYSFQRRNGPNFVNTFGTLAPDGTGAAQFAVDPGDLAPAVGTTFAFAFATLDPADFPSNPVSVVIDP